MVGIGYVIDHCVSYFTKRKKEILYETYVTDALKVIANNSARQGGTTITKRFADIIDDIFGVAPAKEEKTAEDVIENIRNKLRGDKK